MPTGVDQTGSFSKFRVLEFSLDRYNIITAQVEKKVFVDAGPESPGQVIDYDLMDIEEAPDVQVPCVAVRFAHEKTIATYTYFYEGLPSWADAGETFFELEGSDNSEPIETHPDFLAIAKKYKALTPNNTFEGFQRIITLEDKPNTLNPLFGAREFFRIGQVWIKTSVTKTLDPEIFVAAGYIDPKPGEDPDRDIRPPELKDRENWLKLAPTARYRGNIWQITERWIRSGKNGWVGDVYNRR